MIDCPLVVRIFNTFRLNKGEGRLCYTMELCEHGDLRGVIELRFLNMNYLSSQEFLSYAYQICRAVYEIHKLDIMH